MLNSSEKTRTCFSPLYDVRVIASLGVSGSMRPLRMLASSGSFCLPCIQRGLPVQGPFSGAVTSWTKVLRCVSEIEYNGPRENLQNGITDEKHKKAERENGQTSEIDYTSPSEDVTVPLVLVVGVGIVQVIVLLHIFRE